MHGSSPRTWHGTCQQGWPQFPSPSVSNGALVYRQLDVSDASGWSALAAWIQSQGWQVDGLVNNAGITQRSRLLEASVADLQKRL